MASIVLELGGQRTEHPLRQGMMTIGRRPDNDICIQDRTVSGQHAQIIVDDDGVYIVDVGSRNGTTVNGKPVTERTKLSDGDRIQFGDAGGHLDDPATRRQGRSDQSPRASGTDTVDGQAAGIAFAEGADDASKIIGSSRISSPFDSLTVHPEAKLKAVLDLSRRLVGSIELDSLLPAILDTLFSIFRYADRGCILLRDEATGKMIPRAFKHRRADEDATVRLSRTIVDHVLKNKEGILSADASTDAQFEGSESISELKIRSMMCVPLLGIDGEPYGIISIDSQNPLGQFTTDDLELLMVVAGQASLSHETARLVHSHVAKQKQDNELQIAKNIQRALLPTTLPQVEGYEFFACYESAQAVGGDYYDCIMLPDGKIAVSFGDVAGKGVPGALIMSRMSSCVQSTLRHVHDVEQAMLAINEHMCDSAVEGRFVTYVLAIVDTINHVVYSSNAGHMAPIIRRADGTIEHFDDDDLVGPPIGVVDGYPYDVETHELAPGDIVVIVTDGVDEAMNPNGDLYGVEQTCATIQNGPAQAAALGRDLLADVRRHAAGRPQNDDITIMAFGRTATGSDS